MLSSLIFSGIGLLLTNPIRRALAGKPKHRNPSKAKRRASKRKTKSTRVAKRLIREVISDEGASRYSRRHRRTRARLIRRGATFDQVMSFNDRHRKNPCRAAARHRLLARATAAAKRNMRAGGTPAAFWGSLDAQVRAGKAGIRNKRISAAVQRGIRRGRRNPTTVRDPHFIGVFNLPDYPVKHKSFDDGDTAVVESPHKPGTYEIWVYGRVDYSAGDSWIFVSKGWARAKAAVEAIRLAKI